MQPQPRKITLAQGTVNEQKIVRLTVDLPEHIYDQFMEQAIALNREVEDVVAQRLARCVGQKDNGLYFSDAQKKELEKYCGRSVGDAQGALQCLKNVSSILCDDVIVELDIRLKQRLDSRAKMQRMTLEKLIHREVMMALRRYVGMEPR